MMLGETLQRSVGCVSAPSLDHCQLEVMDFWILVVLLVGILLVAHVFRKLVRNLLTLRALALMPTLSRRLANWVKARDYTEEEFLRADGAGKTWVERARKPLTGWRHF